jgi:oligosaccharide repeat unit polymerase
VPPTDLITPAPGATACLIAGIAVTPSLASGHTASGMAHDYAVFVGLALVLSLVVDYRRNLRNIVRADLMAIASLYFLTLFEFLLPQPAFDSLVTLQEVQPALNACLFGFAGLALGRHLAPPAGRSLRTLLRREVSPKLLIILFAIALFGGYFYMLLAVDFNVFDLVDCFMWPRFTQPWGRGRLGDWKALVGEFGMILYLVPPIAGIVYAKRREFSPQQRLFVAAGFLFTMFYGFSSGTRNIFATYLTTFLVAYAFTSEGRNKRELLTICILSVAAMVFATVTMLEFRNIGLRAYISGYKEVKEDNREKAFFVDYNLYVISKLAEAFPRRFDYLGFEIPYLAVIRPIPRAIWAGKPEGMSIPIEDAVGVEGLTLASSFVGEAYMSGGMLGVLLTGLAFGSITGWWNRLGQPGNSAFGQLVFASGFFAAVISMRSMFVFTTAILPTVAALVLGNWLIDKRRRRHSTSLVESTALNDSPPDA